MADPFEELEKLAESAKTDIANDLKANDLNPNYEPDLGYNLYVEEALVLGIGAWPYASKQTVGVIDMGDLYQAVFVWVNNEWEQTTLDAYEIEERILEKRRND